MKLIDSLRSVIVETWSVKKSTEFLKPNEKPSKSDPTKGLYRKMIEKLLIDNSDKLEGKGIENVRGHWFYKGTEKGHPLSYLNTHYGVATFLMKYYNLPKDITKEDAISELDVKLRQDFDKFFLDDTSKEYNAIYEILGKSRIQGDENEIQAEKYLKSYYGDQIENINIVSETGGSMDKSGVDMVVTMKEGTKLNYQVKPFKFYRVADDGMAVIYGVSGRTPVNSKQDRWIFVAPNKFLEVKSENLSEGMYQRDVMFLPATDIISKSENLKPWIPKEKNIE
jgi:hypothetical protein